MGSKGGVGAFRLVNSTWPQTGFDSVCVALKVTRKKGGQTGGRDGPTEGRYKRREKPSKQKKQYSRKKKKNLPH